MELLRLPAEPDTEAAERAILARLPRPGQWLRIEVPLPTADPASWLLQHAGPEPLAWLTRDDRLQVCGQGVAARLAGAGEPSDGFAQLARRLVDASPRERWFAAVAFAPQRQDATWAGVPDWQFLLPQWELGRDADGAWLALHTDGRAAALLPRRTPPESAPRVQSLRHVPDSAAWTQLFGRAQAAFAAGELRKVVLARRTDLHFDRPVDPVALWSRLAAQEPGTFRFLLPLRPGASFLGASPERVLCLDGQRVRIEALAGTAARGLTQAQDFERRAALKASAKDAVEHEIVRAWLVEALVQLGCAVAPEQPREIRTYRRVMHLFTGIEAELAAAGDAAPAERIARLLEAIYPSPALCGAPRAAAQALLARSEPFVRGLYCGAVGLVHAGGCELAAGLRSALVREAGHVAAFAGAGIVAASDCAQEWQELGAKTSAVLAAAGAAADEEAA